MSSSLIGVLQRHCGDVDLPRPPGQLASLREALDRPARGEGDYVFARYGMKRTVTFPQLSGLTYRHSPTSSADSIASE